MRNAQASRSPRSADEPGRVRSLVTILLIVAMAALYLGWRIPHHDSSESTLGNILLISASVCAAFAALFAARRNPADRRGWLLIALGCSLWSVAQSIRDADGETAMLVYTGAFLVTTLLFMMGCGMLAGLGRGAGGIRQLGIDVVPPFIALLTAIWLIDISPFLDRYDVPTGIAVASVAHGLSAAGLLVFGMTGIFASQTLRLHPSTQSVMVGMALIAIADAFWMQRWIDRDVNYAVASDVAFVVGFVMLAIAGSQARNIARWRSNRANFTVVAKRLTPQATPTALFALLGLLLLQGWLGEWTPNGIVITASAGLVVVLFQMMWERLVTERETALSEEIDVLSERIDGLVSQVGRDALTGLHNRRAFQDRLEAELLAGRRNGTSVAMALIDVDNFKLVNDTYGHQVGDQVLQAVASILLGVARSTDVAARYAGDEFVILLPGVTEEDAAAISYRMLEHVRLINEQLHEIGEVGTSLSIGVALTETCKRNASQLTAIADAAMYDAKESGKDRVVAINADTLTAAAWLGVSATATPAVTVPARKERRSTRTVTRAAS